MLRRLFLNRLVIDPAQTGSSFFMLEPAMKSSLAVALGHLVASSPLEALIMRGDLGSNGMNCIPGPMMASFFPVRQTVTSIPCFDIPTELRQAR